jgi:predicted nucleotidyltransferase
MLAAEDRQRRVADLVNTAYGLRLKKGALMWWTASPRILGEPPVVRKGNEVPMRRSARRSPMQVLIGRMVKQIVKEFDPEQVILFGSQARGDAGPDSDVDLLVVMDVQGAKLEQRLAIRAALRDFLVPMDILVTTPEDFAWRKDVVGTIEWPAFREGKVLYARA